MELSRPIRSGDPDVDRIPTSANRAGRRFAGRIFLGGVVIAGLFALPLVNLVAPVIATAFMLHIFEALPRLVEHPVEHPFGRTP